MPKKIEIDVDKIIATNPKVDPASFRESVEALKKLERTGVVKQSSYSLDTPDSRRRIQYCREVVIITRGSTIRLKNR